MEEERASGRPELAHQSLGRPLTKPEDQLAEALMAAYADGAADQAALAETLAAKGVVRPSTGQPDWTPETLGAELKALDADHDAAYQENGFGA